MYRICIHCYWRDRKNFQCFDGHAQYKCRQECPGFIDTVDYTAEDAFIAEQERIAFEEFIRCEL